MRASMHGGRLIGSGKGIGAGECVLDSIGRIVGEEVAAARDGVEGGEER